MQTSNSTIIQSVTPEALADTFRQIVREELQALNETPTQKKYYTRKETAARLRISLPSLSNYSDEGLITASRIGTRVLYSEDAVNAAVKDIPAQRYRRR
jgi:hypothetical protein